MSIWVSRYLTKNANNAGITREELVDVAELE
jgi:hypothetical protein